MWRNVKPPEKIIFPQGFLETGVQQLLGSGQETSVPRIHCSFTHVERDRSSRLFLFNCAMLEDLCRLRARRCAVRMSFVSARPARSHGLKLSQTPLALHLMGTLSSHQKIHLYCPVPFGTRDATLKKREMTMGTKCH